MGKLILILILLVIVTIIYYVFKTDKARQAEKNGQKDARSKASERIMGPERKLHREEKKRWEDDYWKRQEKRDPQA